MTRPTTAPAPVAADDDGQTLAAIARAAGQDACDTAASTPIVMAPRSSPPSKASAAPVQAGAAANAPHAGENATLPRGQMGPPEPPEPAHLHEPLGPDDPLAPLPFNPYKGNRGVMRAWHALKYSIKGFRVAIREESAFRQELTLAAILVPIGVFVPVEPVERVLLLGSVMLVLIVELLNSSIENAVDRIGLERNELSGRAKDLGSAAVTVALLTCVMSWGLILVPRFGPALLRWLGVR